MSADTFDRALAFHYRHAERSGAVAWQPARDESLVYDAIGVVVMYASGERWAAYSFHVTTAGALRFRALEPDVRTLAALTKAAAGGERALARRDSAAAARAMAKLGLSTREMGRALGVSHETARSLT